MQLANGGVSKQKAKGGDAAMTVDGRASLILAKQRVFASCAMEVRLQLEKVVEEQHSGSLPGGYQSEIVVAGALARCESVSQD